MKKEKPLSEKIEELRDTLNIDSETLDRQFVIASVDKFEEDVKQTFKDILDEIFSLINRDEMKIDTISYLQHLEETIKQKAGFEELK